MADENKNSGEEYVALVNSNISKLAEVITAEGGLMLTDQDNGGVSAVNLVDGAIVVG